MDDGSGTENGLRHGVTEPAHRGDERTALLGFLQRQRDLVIWKVRDGDDNDLRSVSTSTDLTVHGIVRHLKNVERSWIQERFAGRTDLAYDWTDEDPDGELHVPAGIPMAELISDYVEESKTCDRIIAEASLDQVAAHRDMSLRWIVLHLIEETGRHLGQLDLLREQADGSVGEEPVDS